MDYSTSEEYFGCGSNILDKLAQKYNSLPANVCVVCGKILNKKTRQRLCGVCAKLQKKIDGACRQSAAPKGHSKTYITKKTEPLA